MIKNSTCINLQYILAKVYLAWICCGFILVAIDMYTDYSECVPFQSFFDEKGHAIIPAIAKRDSPLNCTRWNEDDVCKANATCIDSICECKPSYITLDDKPFCGYKQISKLLVFLLSFFVGGLGVDWFILARGNACYHCGGAAKLLTCGGLGIWWLVDWIRILANDFKDGNGVDLYADM